MNSSKHKKIQLIRAAISLIASGIILALAIGFAWFALNQEIEATGLTLTVQPKDCDVEYILTSDEAFANTKPGDVMPYEIKVYNITKSGSVNVQLDGITYTGSVEVDGVQYDMRDLFTVTLILPDDSENVALPISLGNKESVTILTDYEVEPDDVVNVKFEFAFLTDLPSIPDINVFQGKVEMDIDELYVYIK